MHLCKMYSCTFLQNTIVLASDQSRFRYSREKSLETLSNSTLTIVSGQNV